MNKREKVIAATAAVMAVAAVSVWVIIVYAAVHFVSKFWW